MSDRPDDEEARSEAARGAALRPEEAPEREEPADEFALEREVVQSVREAVWDADRERLLAELDPLHAADLADLLEQLPCAGVVAATHGLDARAVVAQRLLVGRGAVGRTRLDAVLGFLGGHRGSYLQAVGSGGSLDPGSSGPPARARSDAPRFYRLENKE